MFANWKGKKLFNIEENFEENNVANDTHKTELEKHIERINKKKQSSQQSSQQSTENTNNYLQTLFEKWNYYFADGDEMPKNENIANNELHNIQSQFDNNNTFQPNIEGLQSKSNPKSIKINFATIGKTSINAIQLFTKTLQKFSTFLLKMIFSLETLTKSLSKKITYGFSGKSNEVPIMTQIIMNFITFPLVIFALTNWIYLLFIGNGTIPLSLPIENSYVLNIINFISIPFIVPIRVLQLLLMGGKLSFADFFFVFPEGKQTDNIFSKKMDWNYSLRDLMKYLYGKVSGTMSGGGNSNNNFLRQIIELQPKFSALLMFRFFFFLIIVAIYYINNQFGKNLKMDDFLPFESNSFLMATTIPIGVLFVCCCLFVVFRNIPMTSLVSVGVFLFISLAIITTFILLLIYGASISVQLMFLYLLFMSLFGVFYFEGSNYFNMLKGMDFLFAREMETMKENISEENANTPFKYLQMFLLFIQSKTYLIGGIGMLIYSLILCTKFKTSNVKLFSSVFVSMLLGVCLMIGIFYRDTFKTQKDIVEKFKETFNQTETVNQTETLNDEFLNSFGLTPKKEYLFAKLEEFTNNKTGIFNLLNFKNGEQQQNIEEMTQEELEEYCKEQKTFLEKVAKMVQNIFIATDDKDKENKRKRKNQMFDLSQKLIELFDGLKYIRLLLLNSQANNDAENNEANNIQKNNIEENLPSLFPKNVPQLQTNNILQNFPFNKPTT
jgi:hypothetical protein